MTSTSTLAGKRVLVTGGSRGIGAAIRAAARFPGSHRRGQLGPSDSRVRLLDRFS